MLSYLVVLWTQVGCTSYGPADSIHGFGAQLAQPMTKKMHQRLVSLIPLLDAHLEDLHFIRGTIPACGTATIVCSTKFDHFLLSPCL